jgi:hypothetical protein
MYCGVVLYFLCTFRGLWAWGGQCKDLLLGVFDVVIAASMPVRPDFVDSCWCSHDLSTSLLIISSLFLGFYPRLSVDSNLACWQLGRD